MSWFSLGLLALAGLIAQPAFAQSNGQADLRKEVEQLKTQMQSMRSDLDEIKAALREQAARANPVFDTGSYPAKGDAAAKLVLIEFSDFQCPYCLEYFKTIYDRLLETYVKTGKLRYVFVDFPGEKAHPEALKAAQAGRCANAQGKFWEMHDQLFKRQRDLATTGMADAAQAAGLNQAAFDACLNSGKYAAPVSESEQAAAKLGLQGTPAFVFGTPDPHDPAKVKLVRALVGNQSYAAFQQTIDGLLSQ